MNRTTILDLTSEMSQKLKITVKKHQKEKRAEFEQKLLQRHKSNPDLKKLKDSFEHDNSLSIEELKMWEHYEELNKLTMMMNVVDASTKRIKPEIIEGIKTQQFLKADQLMSIVRRRNQVDNK